MRKLFYLEVSIVILVLIISGCIFPVVPPSGKDEPIDIVKDAVFCKINLIAGQYTIAGSIIVSNDDKNLFITYETVDNWLINETHLYVSSTIPTNSAPGKFPYKHEELGGVTTDTYEIPLENLGVATCDKIYIAAHAELFKGKTEETGWAEGVEIRPDKNLAMYFEYWLSCMEEIATQILETQDLGRQYFEQLESQGDPNALQKTINYLKTQPNVDNAEVGEDGVSIWVEYKSGVEGIILTELFRSLGNLSVSKSYRSNLPKKSADKNAIILLPFDSVAGYEDESVDEISSYLQQSGYSIPDIYRAEEVTVDLMNTLSNYDFIYMLTHGGVGSSGLIEITIGQAVNAFSIVPLWNSLTGDLKEISIVSIPSKFWIFDIPGIVFALNSRFFAHYTYPGSFVYMNACSSLKNDSLADAFLNNGASVYLGWDNPSAVSLGNEHNPEFFQELAKPNNTLQQAYDATLAKYYPALVYKDTNHNKIYHIKLLNGEEGGNQDDKIVDYALSLIFKGNSQFILNPSSKVEGGTAIPWTFHSDSAIMHQINIFWNVYEGANGYKVYRQVNNSNDWQMVFQGEGDIGGELSEKREWYDQDVQLGNTYEYYVVAYGDDWETNPNFLTGPLSQFLPAIYLESPSDQSMVSDPDPTLQWTPLGGIPAGFNGPSETELLFYDATTNELIWQALFVDVTTSSVTYNQDGQATASLIPDHTYGWKVRNFAYDQNMEDVITQSEYWEFIFGTSTAPVHNLTNNIYYDTIQAALNEADGGDTIEVADGTYIENIDINKDHLTIKSENGAEVTIVQAANSDDHVFEVTANYVNISGFTVKGAAASPPADPLATPHSCAGIYLRANYCNVFSNKALSNDIGIYLDSSSNNNIMENNISSSKSGIWLRFSNNNTIANNSILNSNNDGMYLWGANQNNIKNNVLVGGDYGIELWDSHTNTLTNNTVSNNNIGILFWFSNNNLLNNCVLFDSGIGIYFLDCAMSVPSEFENCSHGNAIYLNDFVNAENLKSPYSTNTWHSPEPITYTYKGNTYTNYLGNYWGDYSGGDADNNGIGDTPYSINSDQDSYPLMELFENYY